MKFLIVEEEGVSDEEAKTSASVFSGRYCDFPHWLASLFFRQKAEDSLDVNQSGLSSFRAASG
jgi:hypothetical protein